MGSAFKEEVLKKAKQSYANCHAFSLSLVLSLSEGHMKTHSYIHNSIHHRCKALLVLNSIYLCDLHYRQDRDAPELETTDEGSDSSDGFSEMRKVNRASSLINYSGLC